MASASSSSSARSSSGLLAARLQRLFKEGERTDMVIRVRVNSDQAQQQEPPAAKRRRTEEQASSAAAAAAATDAADSYTDIPAHSLVLCASSPYFDKALSGEWTEAAERRIELVVEDEQELADLRLLIKLSYSDSYTHDDGQLLPLAIRLRLAARADALEFVEAVEQLVASLSENLSYDEAQTLMDALPPAVKQHAGMAAVRSKITVVLVKGIEEREGKAGKEQEIEAGGTALAKCLGPVAGMFEVGGKLIEGTLPLTSQVKQLPFAALKGLLTSEALELQVENEAYALLMAWLHQSPHIKSAQARMGRFKALAPLLRYQHMTHDFVANVVAQCPLMQRSGLLPVVVRVAFVQRDVRPTFLTENGVERGLLSRGASPSKGLWEVKASFSLEDVKLEPERRIVKWCSLVAGYPAGLYVKRATEKDKDKGSLAIRLKVHMGQQSDGAKGVPAAGVCLQTEFKLPSCESKTLTRYFGGAWWGWADPFRKSWAEAVREGSPHFPDGKLEIKATAMLANQKS